MEGDNPSLRSNKLARRLLKFILTNREVPDFLRLISLFIRDNNPDSLGSVEPIRQYEDLRINKLLLKNVRQYCSYSENADGYCLDFTGKGNPVSSVYLGANGSGKTTLFASLEYLYLGHSEIAAAHGHSDNVLDFFRSINISSEFISMECETLLSKPCEGNRLNGYEIPAAFCSECDYFGISRDWNNFTPYVAYQIGYQFFWKLLQNLKDLEVFFKFSTEYQKRDSLLTTAKSTIKQLEKDSKDYKAIESYIKGVKEERKVINMRFLASGGDKYYNDIYHFIIQINKCKNFADNQNDFFQLLSFMERKWQEILNTIVNILKSVMPAVMESNLIKEKEKIKINENKGNLEIILSVTPRNADAQDMDEKNPVEYFNTFRLKLFCISLKLSLLACSKIFHKVNLPFFVDDIFDSSDFHHRASIGNFILRLLEAHDSVIANHSMIDESKMPLQIIFFTQDNIIGENVFNGIRRWSEENDMQPQLGVKFNRLFTPADAIVEVSDETQSKEDCHGKNNELQSSDKKSVTINSSNKTVINITDPI